MNLLYNTFLIVSSYCFVAPDTLNFIGDKLALATSAAVLHHCLVFEYLYFCAQKYPKAWAGLLTGNRLYTLYHLVAR